MNSFIANFDWLLFILIPVISLVTGYLSSS